MSKEQKLEDKDKALHISVVMPRFLTVIIMALTQTAVTLLVKDLDSYIAFPIAYLTGWILCLVWNRLYP